jgi:hypothetical protein
MKNYLFKKLSLCSLIAIASLTTYVGATVSTVLANTAKTLARHVEASDVIAFLIGAYNGAPETLPKAAATITAVGVLGGVCNKTTTFAYNLFIADKEPVQPFTKASYAQYFGRTSMAYGVGAVAGHIWRHEKVAAVRTRIKETVAQQLKALEKIMPRSEVVTTAAMIGGGLALYYYAG